MKLSSHDRPKRNGVKYTFFDFFNFMTHLVISHQGIGIYENIPKMGLNISISMKKNSQERLERK